MSADGKHAIKQIGSFAYRKDVDDSGSAEYRALRVSDLLERLSDIPKLTGLGIATNLADAEGRTIMMHAAERGDGDALMSLITENHARIDDVDHTGETALMKAARAGEVGTVRMLVLMDAEIHMENEHGKTALHLVRDKETAQVLHASYERQQQLQRSAPHTISSD